MLPFGQVCATDGAGAATTSDVRRPMIPSARMRDLFLDEIFYMAVRRMETMARAALI
jgi:hypothetical protein